MVTIELTDGSKIKLDGDAGHRWVFEQLQAAAAAVPVGTVAPAPAQRPEPTVARVLALAAGHVAGRTAASIATATRSPAKGLKVGVDVRSTDAERERTAQVLRRAAGVGALNLEELDERLSKTYGALTQRDLEGLTADLPPVTTPTNGAGEEPRWWWWAVFAMPFAAWLHAFVLTKCPKFGFYAAIYFLPALLLGALGGDNEQPPNWATAIYVCIWLVGLVHALMSRDEVQRRIRMRQAEY